MPLIGEARIYKEEVYFNTKLDLEKENARGVVDKGDIGFWPQGNAICFFYGDTDPVSPVNVFAKIKGELNKFKEIDQGDKIKLKIK